MKIHPVRFVDRLLWFRRKMDQLVNDEIEGLCFDGFGEFKNLSIELNSEGGVNIAVNDEATDSAVLIESHPLRYLKMYWVMGFDEATVDEYFSAVCIDTQAEPFIVLAADERVADEADRLVPVALEEMPEGVAVGLIWSGGEDAL